MRRLRERSCLRREQKTWVVPTVQIERKVRHRTPFVFEDWTVPMEKEFGSRKVSDTEPTEEEIRHILRKTGKYTRRTN